MSINEAAVAVGCSYWTVWRYVKQGVVSATKDARGEWRLPRAAVQKIRRHIQKQGGPGGRPLPLQRAD